VTGFGIIEERGQSLLRVASGEIKTDSKSSLPRRLRKIHGGLLEVIREHSPAVMVVESTFLDKNFQSALKLGQARGVAMLAADMAGLPVEEYTPAEIKKAVAGHGAGGKDQVERMVGTILRLNAPLSSHHAADALSVAVCHAHSARFRSLLREAGAR